MTPFFLSLAFAALTAQPAVGGREMPVVEVHEWGVITLDDCYAILAARPAGRIDPASLCPPADAPAARAPVVYFYGPPFKGSFTVEAVSGQIISTWPEPSTGTATWRFSADWPERDSAPTDLPTGRVHPSIIEGWDATGWRVPQSMTLVTEERYVDKFIYYECTVDPSVLPVRPRPVGVDVEDGYEDMPALLIIPSYAGTTIMPLRAGVLENPADLLRNCLVEPVDMLSVLYEWSRDKVDLDEVDALWGTWKGWFNIDGLPAPESGRVLMVYPVPAEVLDGICTLDLTTEEGYTVEYHRFILCATTVALRKV